MKIKIYGHSDDCIELDGDLREEFYSCTDGPNYISCSDGSLLTIEYGSDDTACWRIDLVVAGTAAYTHVLAAGEGAKGKQNEGGGYSDLATLEGVDIKWVAITDKDPSQYWMENPASVIQSLTKSEHPWDAIVWKSENGKISTHRKD